MRSQDRVLWRERSQVTVFWRQPQHVYLDLKFTSLHSGHRVWLREKDSGSCHRHTKNVAKTACLLGKPREAPRWPLAGNLLSPMVYLPYRSHAVICVKRMSLCVQEDPKTQPKISVKQWTRKSRLMSPISRRSAHLRPRALLCLTGACGAGRTHVSIPAPVDLKGGGFTSPSAGGVG